MVVEAPLWTVLTDKDAQVRPISSFNPAVYMPKGYPKNPGGRKDFSVVRRWPPACS